MEESIRPPKDTIHHKDTWNCYKEAFEELYGRIWEPKFGKKERIFYQLIKPIINGIKIKQQKTWCHETIEKNPNWNNPRILWSNSRWMNDMILIRSTKMQVAPSQLSKHPSNLQRTIGAKFGIMINLGKIHKILHGQQHLSP
jgi:hypothetical protein